MFIKLRAADSRLDVHVAIDQIASFTAYDRYRPNYMSWVVMKDGIRYQVAESTDEISAMITAARNVLQASPFQQQYVWEADFAKNQPSGVECQVSDCTGHTNWGWCSLHTPLHYAELP